MRHACLSISPPRPGEEEIAVARSHCIIAQPKTQPLHGEFAGSREYFATKIYSHFLKRSY